MANRFCMVCGMPPAGPSLAIMHGQLHGVHHFCGPEHRREWGAGVDLTGYPQPVRDFVARFCAQPEKSAK